jgi:protein-S-isoprenylcysteine O-methyltransferase Ste14
LPLTIGLAGAAAFVWYGSCALRVVRENGMATGHAMVDFLQPSHLLVEGAYARVRHPMFLCDFLAHSGLAVAAGALTTFALLPVYFALSAMFNAAEERWVLKPSFGETFERYRTRVPGYMTRGAALVLCLLVLGTGFVALR